MTEPAPTRVRITSPRWGAAQRAAPRAIAREIGEHTELGEVYVRSLIRTQLRLAVGVCLAAAVILGGLPLVFDLAPGLAGAHVAGIPLAWLVLGVLAYPVLIVLGWRFVLGAERREQAFLDEAHRD